MLTHSAFLNAARARGSPRTQSPGTSPQPSETSPSTSYSTRAGGRPRPTCFRPENLGLPRGMRVTGHPEKRSVLLRGPTLLPRKEWTCYPVRGVTDGRVDRSSSGGSSSPRRRPGASWSCGTRTSPHPGHRALPGPNPGGLLALLLRILRGPGLCLYRRRLRPRRHRGHGGGESGRVPGPHVPRSHRHRGATGSDRHDRGRRHPGPPRQYRRLMRCRRLLGGHRHRLGAYARPHRQHLQQLRHPRTLTAAMGQSPLPGQGSFQLGSISNRDGGARRARSSPAPGKAPASEPPCGLPPGRRAPRPLPSHNS